MPRGDRTGPRGEGAMSGRRMGYCVGNNVAGYQDYAGEFPGRGGFGFRHRFGYGGSRNYGGYGFRYGRRLFPSEPIDKKSLLEEQINELKAQLKELENQHKKLD
jgi:hypothetical protein